MVAERGVIVCSYGLSSMRASTTDDWVVDEDEDDDEDNEMSECGRFLRWSVVLPAIELRLRGPGSE